MTTLPTTKHALVIEGSEQEKQQACIEIRDWAVKNNITMPAILTYESILNFSHCNYILWNGTCLDACLRNFSVVGYTIHHTVESFKKVFEVEESELRYDSKIFTPPFRLGHKQKRAVLDSEGREVVIMPHNSEKQAQLYVDYLNKSTIIEFNPIELTNPKNDTRRR